MRFIGHKKKQNNLTASGGSMLGAGGTGPPNLAQAPKFLIGSIVISPIAVVASQMMRGQPQLGLRARPNWTGVSLRRSPKWVTLNNASDYQTNGLHLTPNLNPNPSPFVR